MNNKILAILDDEDVLVYNKMPMSHVGETEFVCDLKEARICIGQSDKEYSAIFLNPSLFENEGYGLLKEVLTHRLGTPLYLFDMGKKISEFFQDITVDEIGVKKFIHEDADLKDVADELLLHSKVFSTKAVIKASLSLQVQNELLLNNLVPIDAANFLSGSKNLFDVFVRLRQEKYVKVLNAGDEFESERLAKYVEKGLDYFYIHKDAQVNYLSYCDKLTSKIISSKDVSTRVKITQTLNHGQETINALRSIGINSSSLEYAEAYAKNVFLLLDKIKSSDNVVTNVISSIKQFDHTAGTVMLSGIIAKAYGVDTKKSIEVIGLGATLHDMGLVSMKEFYKHDDRYKLFDEYNIELELASDACPTSRKRELSKEFEKHPAVGAKMAENIEGLDPLVIQIIEQHHMRKDGSGYPRFKTASLNPLGQLVSAADEFSKLIIMLSKGEKEKDSLIDFIKSLDLLPGRVKRATMKALFNK